VKNETPTVQETTTSRQKKRQRESFQTGNDKASTIQTKVKSEPQVSKVQILNNQSAVYILKYIC
jgi:hypothetical protein